jgi:DNA-binding MarR family transcriptional regulator
MSLDQFTNLSQQWRRVNALWYKIFMNFLKETNLTYTEAIVLLATFSLDQPTKSDISHYMRCEPQSITRAINSLVSKNLLKRYIDTEDKRFTRFDLTSAGKSFSIQTQEFINKNWEKSLSHMSSNDLEVFTVHLNKMINELDQISIKPF